MVLKMRIFHMFFNSNANRTAYSLIKMVFGADNTGYLHVHPHIKVGEMPLDFSNGEIFEDSYQK